MADNFDGNVRFSPISSVIGLAHQPEQPHKPHGRFIRYDQERSESMVGVILQVPRRLRARRSRASCRDWRGGFGSSAHEQRVAQIALRPV
jgi:hypothetical protein